MQNIPDDEIDLVRMGRRLQAILLYPFQQWYRYPRTTLLFILTGILVAVAIKYTLPKIYRSSFIIRPVDKTEKFHLKMIGDLQRLLKIRDYQSLSEELNIDDGSARSIAGIEVSNPYVKNRGDSINYTEVTIDAFDHNQLLHLQNGILNYLEGNPYFKKIKNLQKRQVTQSLELVEKDLERLDRLKQLQIETYAISGHGNKNLIPLNDLIHPTDVYSMAAERMNRKAALQAQLEFLDNFQLVKSCVVVKQHRWPPRILVTSLVTVPVFLLLCLLFLYFKKPG